MARACIESTAGNNAKDKPLSQPELPDGIQFIERDWLSANNVMLFDGDEVAIVDTGYVKHQDLTVALVENVLAKRGAESTLTRIINTHLHSDHCGGNAALQARFRQACTSVSASSYDAVTEWDEQVLGFRETGQSCPRFRADGALSPGDRFDGGGLRWEVLSAPGHDPKSLIFFEPAHRLLISADALWRHGFGLIFPELINESGFAEQASILNVIEDINPTFVLPGHGPVFNEINAAIAESRARLQALRADPDRNRRSALRALVMFKMLELETTTRDDLQASLANATLMAHIAQTLNQSLAAALDQAIDNLLDRSELHTGPHGRISTIPNPL